MGDFDIWRVLVSAPGDIDVERDCVDHAIRTVNRSLEARGDRLRLELHHWRRDVVPGAHAESVQDLIEEQLRFDNCDILVGIFWKRLGTPVAGAPSGSAREIRIAHDAWTASGRPRILAYFNKAPTSFASIAEAENHVALLRFKEELRDRKILTVDYDGDREFERLLIGDLLAKALGSSQEVEKASQSVLSCRMQGSAPELRAEGFAEYAGDIVLRFQFTETDRPHDTFETREVDIDISLDTWVVGLKNGPAPRMFVYERYQTGSGLDGRYIGNNGVRFERVPVHYGSLLCITDILLNATAKGVVVANVHSEVYATATITEGVKQLRISGNGATVGTVRHSLLFSPSRPPARLAKESVIEGELLGEHACISYLNFKPAFPHALRSRSNEAARLGGSVSEIQF